MTEEDKFKREIDSLQKDIFAIIETCEIEEQAFIFEYLKDFSRSKAYHRAIGSKRGNTASYVMGHTMYHSLEDKIEAIAKILIKKNSIDILKILNRLKNAATFDIKDLHNEDGSMKNINDMPDSVTTLMESIEVIQKPGAEIDEAGNMKSSPSDTIKVKFPSRMKAEEMLAKYYDMYSDKIELTGFTSLVDLVRHKQEKDNAK